MLIEISRRSIFISKIEEPLLSWHKSVLTVRTDKGIHMFDFSYNLQCLDKNLDLSASYIGNPKSSPAEGMFSSKLLKSEISNLELTQMIVDPGLWPYNRQLTHEMASIVAFQWAPVGILRNKQNILCILNNIGNVEFYTSQRYKWASVLNLSSIIKGQYDNSQFLKAPNSFEVVKNAIDALESSAISWGTNPNEASCYFVTGQRNGNLLFWIIQCTPEGEVHAEFRGNIQTSIGEIMTILWIPISQDTFLLVCANDMGEIHAFRCKIAQNIVTLLQTTCLWLHQDRMIAKYLLHTCVDDKLLLVANKHRHLLVQMIDENCNILSQSVTNVNDYRITDIAKNEDGIYLSTVNSKLYKINLVVTDDNLNTNISVIDTKDTYSTYELYNFGFSDNNIIWAFAMMDRKLMSRKHAEKIDIVFLTRDMQFETEVPLLLDNPTKRLTNFGDCIELLRLKTMKTKALPAIDYVQLYIEANTDVYKLKVYLIFVILYNTLEEIIKNASRGLLPETSVAIVREKILVSHARGFITNLFNAHKSNGHLNGFELESFIAARNFLEHVCRSHNSHINTYVAFNVLNLVKTELEYTCQSCEETLEGMICKNGHINMMCTISFTAIEGDDYLSCKSCNSTARIELCTIEPLCLFCDLHLNRFC